MSRENTNILIILFVFLCGSIFSAEERPFINIQIKEKNIFTEQKFEVDVLIKAEKTKDPYCFFPPVLKTTKVDDSLSLNIKKISTEETENEVNLKILLEGIAQEPGEYEIGPLEVPYVLLTSDIEGMFIKNNTGVIPTSQWIVPSINIKVRDGWFLKYSKLIYTGLVIIIFFSLSLILILLFIYRDKGVKQKEEITVGETLHIARKYRLDGNYYEYLKTLYEILKKLEGKGDKEEYQRLEQKLRDKMNEVGYRGIKPTEQEMDVIWKEVTNFTASINVNENT